MWLTLHSQCFCTVSRWCRLLWALFFFLLLTFLHKYLQRFRSDASESMYTPHLREPANQRGPIHDAARKYHKLRIYWENCHFSDAPGGQRSRSGSRGTRESRPAPSVGHSFPVEWLRVRNRLITTKEQKSLGLRLKSHFQRFYLQRIYSRNQTYDFFTTATKHNELKTKKSGRKTRSARSLPPPQDQR